MTVKITIQIRMIVGIVIIFIGLVSNSNAKKNERYDSSNCPVAFVVPSEMELYDVEGWTDPSEKTVCRISILWKSGRSRSIKVEKSFDDVRYLSDILITVTKIPIRDRLIELNYQYLNGHVVFNGEKLSADAISMGYQLLQTLPAESYVVGNGNMYVGTQYFSQLYDNKKKLRHSVSYSYLLGNDEYSIVSKMTYDHDDKTNATKIASYRNLLRSAIFYSADKANESELQDIQKGFK